MQGGKGRAGEDVPSIYIQCVDEEGPSEAHRKGEGTEEENNRVLSEELRARLRSSGVGGTSLVVQWLRLCASNAGVRVPSLVGELRSHTLWGMVKIK